MNYERTAPAAKDPISLVDAKAHLRVDHSDEDSYITTLITSVVAYAENYTDRQFIDATWVLRIDEFPNGNCPIELRKNPIDSISTIKYFDSDDAEQTWDAAKYESDLTSNIARIRPVEGESYPTTKDKFNAVEITFISGYGLDESDVPGDIRHAMLLMIAFLFDNRDTVKFDGRGLGLHMFPSVVTLLLDQVKNKSFV